MQHSIHWAYTGVSPGLVRTANSCAIVQFLEKDSFLPNKRRKKTPPLVLCDLLVYGVPRAQMLVTPKARIVTGTNIFPLFLNLPGEG